MDSESKNYELAYILSPAIPEEGVLAAAGKLTAALEEAHGMIRRAETPKKRRLAYAIKKETGGYFGWTTFTMARDAVVALEKKIKENKDLLRHLIVEEEIETRIPYVRPLSGARRAPATQRVSASPAAGAQEIGGDKLDLEALDKKLEEILGK